MFCFFFCSTSLCLKQQINLEIWWNRMTPFTIFPKWHCFDTIYKSELIEFDTRVSARAHTHTHKLIVVICVIEKKITHMKWNWRTKKKINKQIVAPEIRCLSGMQLRSGYRILQFHQKKMHSTFSLCCRVRDSNYLFDMNGLGGSFLCVCAMTLFFSIWVSAKHSTTSDSERNKMQLLFFSHTTNHNENRNAITRKKKKTVWHKTTISIITS